MAKPISYKAALRWLLENDDTEWLNDPEPMFSVTLALVADIYQGGDTDKATKDLRNLRDRGWIGHE